MTANGVETTATAVLQLQVGRGWLTLHRVGRPQVLARRYVDSLVCAPGNMLIW